MFEVPAVWQLVIKQAHGGVGAIQRRVDGHTVGVGGRARVTTRGWSEVAFDEASEQTRLNDVGKTQEQAPGYV